MRSLPDALAPLAAYRQFILCKLVPNGAKTLKLPCDWRTGQPCDAHDPQFWSTFEHIASVVVSNPEQGYCVGFTFTAHDPFWFIDIDHCWTGTTWTPIVYELCGQLAGCASEISQSGTGLHLFGRGTPPTLRRIKDHTNQLFDLYTERRFVALTGDGAAGDANTDHTTALGTIVAKHLTPTTPTQAASWTTEPMPEWRGPTDDDDLIRRALMSAGLSSFGGATFADLWQCNVDVLARVYPPDPNSSDAFGASTADSALVSHLLFWTGKNCERTRELMKRSALVRDKWQREDYLERTILKAAAVVAKVLQDKEIAPPVTVSAPTSIATSTFVPSQKLGEVFAGCVYVQDNNAMLMPTGKIIDQQRFNMHFGGMAFCLDAENDKIAKHPWDAYANNRVTRLPRAESTCFRPDMPFQSYLDIQGLSFVNAYKPPVVARKPGDPTPFITHIRKLLPHGDDALIFISYMCAVVQYPGYKFRWAPFLQGVEGNGKGLILEALIRALGDKYVFMIGPDMIANGFNAWAENNVLYVADDIFRTDNRETMMDGLRRYITEQRHPVTYKGIDATNKRICGNWVFFDNHAELMRITDKTRRICALYCEQQHVYQLESSGLNESYFNYFFIPWLNNGGYEIVADYLHTAPIDPRYNPAGACQRAPKTTSTALAIADGRTVFDADLVEWIETGEPGFCGGYISVTMLKRRMDKPPSSVRLRQMLGALGYVAAGRVSRKVHPDEAQSIIYAKIGMVVVDLAAEYEAAQLRGNFHA
jgi:hypothetical protein